MKQYILKGHTPVVENDILKWGQLFMENREVKQTTLPNGVRVSTVFLGIDHRFREEGEPILFETMVFGGDHDQYQDRYSTWEESEKGHDKVVAKLLKELQ